MKFQGNSGHFAELIKDDLKYLGNVDLHQYYVKGYIMHDDNEHDRGGIQVDFVFGRRSLNHALTEFMPPIFICIVSFYTSFFKVNQ